MTDKVERYGSIDIVAELMFLVPTLQRLTPCAKVKQIRRGLMSEVLTQTMRSTPEARNSFSQGYVEHLQECGQCLAVSRLLFDIMRIRNVADDKVFTRNSIHWHVSRAINGPRLPP